MHQGPAHWRRARFILPMRTGCVHVLRRGLLFVLQLALKSVSCLCLSEKRRVFTSQDLFVLPGLKHSLIHVMKEIWGLSKAPHDVCYIHFSVDEDEIYSQFEFKSQGIVCGLRGT